MNQGKKTKLSHIAPPATKIVLFHGQECSTWWVGGDNKNMVLDHDTYAYCASDQFSPWTRWCVDEGEGHSFWTDVPAEDVPPEYRAKLLLLP